MATIPTSNISMKAIAVETSSPSSNVQMAALRGASIAYTGGNATAVTNNTKAAPDSVREYAGYTHNVLNSHPGPFNQQYRVSTPIGSGYGNALYALETAHTSSGGGYQANQTVFKAFISLFTYYVPTINCAVQFVSAQGGRTYQRFKNASGTAINMNSNTTAVVKNNYYAGLSFGGGVPDSYGIKVAYVGNAAGEISASSTSGAVGTNVTTQSAGGYSYYPGTFGNTSFQSLSSGQTIGFQITQQSNAEIFSGSVTSKRDRRYLIQYIARKAGYYDFVMQQSLVQIKTQATSLGEYGGYEDYCLTNNMLVQVQGKGLVRVYDLELGDMIADGTTFTEIVDINKDHPREGYYTVDDWLEITNDHPMLIEGKWVLPPEYEGNKQYHKQDTDTVYIETASGTFLVFNKDGSKNIIVSGDYKENKRK